MYLVFRSLFVVSLLTTVSFGLAACNTPGDDSVATVEEAVAEESAAMEEGALAAVVVGGRRQEHLLKVVHVHHGPGGFT